MRVIEAEAKAMLARRGLATPFPSRIYQDGEIAEPWPHPVAVKAQTLSGKRAEAGLVRLAPGADVPETVARIGEAMRQAGLPPVVLVEAQADIAADLIVAGEAMFRQSLVEERERLAEEVRRQAEARRKRLAELESRRLEDLKHSGELLREAENIRAVVANVRAAVLAGAREISPDELSRWEEWALGYADRLDPVMSGQVLTHIRAPEPD